MKIFIILSFATGLIGLSGEFSLIVYLFILFSLSVSEVVNSSNWGRVSYLAIDNFRFWMLFILYFSIILAVGARNPIYKSSGIRIAWISIFLSLIIRVMFLTKNLLIFYVFFEISVIPIFMIISGWGYQPERVSAGLAIFFYTAFCSTPLLILVLIIFKNMGRLSWFLIRIFVMKNSSDNSLLLSFIFFIAFLVKIPIFGVHLWLPKAHVEAPVNGSIILAAILLKLGGLGLLRVIPFVFNAKLIILSLIGVAGIFLIRFICINIFDIKIIIAYSSVAHITLVVVSICRGLKFGAFSRLAIIIRHAFISSRLFFGITKIYENNKSRRIVVNSGNLVTHPKFILAWFFTIMASIATPPLIRFFSEILCFYIIYSTLKFSYLLIIFTIFLAGGYSLVIYTSSQHGKIRKKVFNLLQITSLDYMVSASHLILFIFSIFLLVIFLM